MFKLTFPKNAMIRLFGKTSILYFFANFVVSFGKVKCLLIMKHRIQQSIFHFSAIMEFENCSGIMFRGTRMDNCHVIQCGGDDTFVSQGEDKVYSGQ